MISGRLNLYIQVTPRKPPSTTLRANTVHLSIATGLMLAFAVCCSDDTDPVDVAGGADRHAPPRIDDLDLAIDSLSYNVVLTWTARGDDADHDRASRYDIRYGESFPFHWDESASVTDPPAPLPAGRRQTFVLEAPSRGRDLYASVRAIDAAGNQSPVGSIAHARVPGYTFSATCTDPFSGLPVAGLDATVTTRHVDHATTGADGRIVVRDLAAGPLGLALATGSATPSYHRFEEALTVTDDVAVMYTMIPFQQPDSPTYASILALLREAVHAPGTERIIRRWHSYPVPWYAPAFVNSFGLDYRALAEQAAGRWNTRVGFQMFAPVASDPAVGVLVEFPPRSEMGIINGITVYESDAAGYPRHDRIRIVDDFSDDVRLYRILLHEFGHTIRLGHLGPGFIMYASQPLPDDISDDEVEMVRLLLALPNGTVLDRYDTSAP